MEGRPHHNIFTDDEIRDVRRRYAADVVAHPALRRQTGILYALAAEYGCSQSNIYLIVTRKTYTRVPQGVPA